MTRFKLAVGAAMALALSACATTPASGPAGPSVIHAEQKAPVTLLVSIDGFRPDYLKRGVTPNLNKLAQNGVFATMRPSFQM